MDGQVPRQAMRWAVAQAASYAPPSVVVPVRCWVATCREPTLTAANAIVTKGGDADLRHIINSGPFR